MFPLKTVRLVGFFLVFFLVEKWGFEQILEVHFVFWVLIYIKESQKMYLTFKRYIVWSKAEMKSWKTGHPKPKNFSNNTTWKSSRISQCMKSRKPLHLWQWLNMEENVKHHGRCFAAKNSAILVSHPIVFLEWNAQSFLFCQKLTSFSSLTAISPLGAFLSWVPFLKREQPST